jgi:hypothetical protein
MTTTETKLTKEQLLDIALTSSALKWQSNKKGRAEYPARYRGKVPLKVRLAKTVHPDLKEFATLLDIKNNTVAHKDNEYYVWVNSYGAVSAILENGEKLGLLPSEFDVTEWHDKN